MNVIKIEECPDYLAPDNAVAREFLSPRNSALERLSIAKAITKRLKNVAAGELQSA